MPAAVPLLRRFAIAALASSLAACAGLPPAGERMPSHALAGDGTALAAIAAVGRPASAPQLSGFRLLPTGNYAFNARIALARRAERTLDVQYYLLRGDAVGRRFLRELRDAAVRGVRVRLLLDDLYTGGEEELLTGLAATPNVEVRLFNPLPVRSGSLLGRVVLAYPDFGRINHRMHNKLFVADNVLSVSGGRNIADEYFMVSGNANFIDIDVLSSGPVVEQLSTQFDDYWNSEHAYPLASVVGAVPDAAAARRRFDEAVAGAEVALPVYRRDPLGAPPVEDELAAGQLGQTFAEARVFADSPAKVAERGPGPPSAMMRNTLQVIGDARSEVVIVSPYFIPGEIGMTMMKQARDAGVRSVVVTNALGATDEPLVHGRYARYRRAMLELGVELYELSPTLARDSQAFGPFGTSFARLHGKAAIVDGRQVFIGSMNLDGRSAVANTELGIVIDSEKVAADMRSLVIGAGDAGMLRVRLAGDGTSLEWVAKDRAGRETFFAEEPGNSWWLRFKLWLLSPLAREELL